MATVRAEPGVVSPFGGSPTIVGVEPWADESDATYADLHNVPVDSRQDQAVGTVPPVPAAVTLAGLAIHIRDKATGDAESLTYAVGIGSRFRKLLSVSLDGTTRDLTYTITDSDLSAMAMTRADLAAELAAGSFNLWCSAGNASTVNPYLHTVYELWLEYTVAGGRRRKPRRLTQRGDGLFSGAPRLIGNRSRQSSNRLNGGFV